jgi:hypothetical protein
VDCLAVGCDFVGLADFSTVGSFFDFSMMARFFDSGSTVSLAPLGGGSGGTTELERSVRGGPLLESCFLAVWIEVSHHVTVFGEQLTRHLGKWLQGQNEMVAKKEQCSRGCRLMIQQSRILAF